MLEDAVDREQQRKAAEREIHDLLRGDHRDHPTYTANRKFYAIAVSNTAFVQRWLAAFCRGRRVLDYCCGEGRMSLWLAAAGADVHGIDISPVSVHRAALEAARLGLSARARFSVMDAELMAFADSCFDLAVVHGVLHHLDPERAYQEIARTLKPDGRVICTEALRHNVFIHLYRKLTPHLRTSWETDHILGRADIDMARKHFGSVRVLKFFHLATIAAVPFRRSSAFERIRRILGAVDNVLLRLPVLKWQAWMVVFELAQPLRPETRT